MVFFSRFQNSYSCGSEWISHIPELERTPADTLGTYWRPYGDDVIIFWDDVMEISISFDPYRVVWVTKNSSHPQVKWGRASGDYTHTLDVRKYFL